MEPSPPKRLKTEETSTAEDDLNVDVSKPLEDFSDEVEYEMLIDDELNGLVEGNENNLESDSDSNASSTSQNDTRIKIEKNDSLEDVKPTVGKLESLQLKAEPDADEKIFGWLGGSDEEDVKDLECSYHRSESGKEFIKVEATMSSKVDQLNCSARLIHADLEIWLHNVGCLMLVDEGFIAKVALLNVNKLKRTTSFAEAKAKLLRQLRIVQIVLDEAKAKRDKQRATLLSLFDHIRLRVAMCRSSASDSAHILRIAESSNKLNYCELCEHLCDNPDISGELKEQAAKLFRIEQEIQRRNVFLERFAAEISDDTRELNSTLQRFCEAVILSKVNALLDTAPKFLCVLLKNIPLRTIFRVHENDVKVFHEMEKVLDEEIFCQSLTDLAKRWIDRVKSSETCIPFVNPIFVSLCRSLEELIVAISASSVHKPEELLRSDQHGWHGLETAIKWRPETSLAWCLEREYKFMFRLLNHFDPATGTVGPFEYSSIKRSFEGTLAEELRVWLCLLDDVLCELNLGPFEQFVTSFEQLLQKSDGDQVEKIRIITHSVGRFIVQTCPLANRAQSDEDKQILHFQLDVVNRAMLGCVNSFRDLLDVVTSYWKNRCEFFEKNAKMEPIKNALLTIVTVALRKDVDVLRVITLLRALNTFIVDLDGVSFDWLVKSLPEKPKNAAIALEYIEPVDSVWSGTVHQAYRVIKPDKFHQLLTLLLDGVVSYPRNYTVDVVTELLKCIKSQLERGSGWSDSDQIVSAASLMAAIRVSLGHLREQAQYVSYEQFWEDCVRPFRNAVERSQTLDEFCKRIERIQGLFQDMQRPNEISLREALRAYDEMNEGNFCADRMQAAYQRYRDQFETYVMESDDVATLASLLRDSVQPARFQEWTDQFKQSELPKILAGVAAVWATLSSTKPHCTQILAVLRLLGADNSALGISSHLAQIGAGQGKSLILILIAAVLALTGHRVQLVCCNDYLAKRDAKKFAGMLEVLGVKQAINYGTYDEMVDAVIAPRVDSGKPMELQTLVSDLVLSQARKQRPVKLKAQNLPVLLVDEVDVFFDKAYNREVFCPGAFPVVPGLDEVQEEIWKSVIELDLRDVQEVTTLIDKFMNTPFFTKKEAFDTFLNNSAPFDLIVTLNATNHVRKQFTNRDLFYEELKPMVENAISVATERAQHADFKLNQQGAITYRDGGERFVTSSIPGYKSVFNYFRLKRDNFELTADSILNYGYLNIGCGLIAYALLPIAFPLILGVTASPLSTLNQYEKETLERIYNIRSSSTVPSFSGCSRTWFNPAQNFTHAPTKSLWMDKIFSQAKAQAVDAKRPVIIFFPTSTLLQEFRTLYERYFDRVQVLTEKTPDKEQRIEEVGIAGRLTLATRGMGRGVDYGGDLHVIQSFFSVDAREEVQIRGRTSRRNAPEGSYELVVFDEHLMENGLIGADFKGTYAELDAARVDVCERESELVFKSMEQNEKNHFTTMTYLKSFFE